MTKQHVGIIYGGKSSEHEVSLRTAMAIINAIDGSKYEVHPIYVDLQGQWFMGEPVGKIEAVNQLRLNQAAELTSPFLLHDQLDVVFPVIHGPNGEDGTLQGLLQLADIPYVGSGVMGSAVGMDKVQAKVVFDYYGLPQGKFLSFTRKQWKQDEASIVQRLEQMFPYPMFVKPANLGSSVGISKAKSQEELIEAIHFAARFDFKIIVEEFIRGREVEIGVLGNDELITSVVGEIVSANDFYDYDAKYKDNSTKLHIPASIPQHVADEMAVLAKRAFKALDLSGLTRVDFFWDEEQDQLYINEVNTLPGFTPVSMYPMLFQKAGLSYSELIERLLQLALEKAEERRQNQVMIIELDN